MTAPCTVCVDVDADPHFRFPTHLVHPETGKHMVFNAWSMAICRDCGAAWHRGFDNEVRLLGMPRRSTPDRQQA